MASVAMMDGQARRRYPLAPTVLLLIMLLVASGCSSGSEVIEVTGDTGICSSSQPAFSGEPLKEANLPGNVVEAVVTCPESHASDSRISGETTSSFRCEYVSRDDVVVAACVADKVITNDGGT